MSLHKNKYFLFSLSVLSMTAQAGHPLHPVRPLIHQVPCTGLMASLFKQPVSTVKKEDPNEDTSPITSSKRTGTTQTVATKKPLLPPGTASMGKLNHDVFERSDTNKNVPHKGDTFKLSAPPANTQNRQGASIAVTAATMINTAQQYDAQAKILENSQKDMDRLSSVTGNESPAEIARIAEQDRASALEKTQNETRLQALEAQEKQLDELSKK